MRRGLARVAGAVASAVIVAAVAGGLAGCSPGPNGLTGITVDAEGHLAAVFAWCDDNPPTMAYLTREPDGGSSSQVVARYRADQLAGRAASLRLDAPAGAWSADEPVPALDPAAEYSVHGRGSAAARTTYVRFHVADRDRVAPGTVLIQTFDRR